MISSDFSEFSGEMRRLATVFRLKASPAELNQLTEAYFGALRRFSMTQVMAAAETWTARETKFPKPAELAGAAPKRATPMPELTGDVLADWLRAERLVWEDAPCSCPPCVEAQVTEKPLRFVPEFDEHDRDVRVLVNGREVTAGHWAHGPELFRWYRARADFYNRSLELGFRGPAVLKPTAKKLTLKEKLEKVFWRAQRAPEPDA